METKKKWTNEEIIVLIDAYKDEQCLYAVNTPNYHNKHLRSAAMKRVGDAVRVSRPHTTDKECGSKFHTLRTQFNIENSKVKSSLKSGTGTDNVYTPSLWYFDQLRFLDAYFTPRKSRASTGSITEDCSQSQEPEGSVRVVCEGFSDDSQFNVYIEENPDDPPLQPPPPPQSPTSRDTIMPVPSTSSSTPPVLNLPSTSSSTPPVLNLPSPAHSVIRPSPSDSPASTSSGVSSTSRLSKRRASDRDAYAGAIQCLAQSLRQPVVVQSPVSQATTTSTSTPPHTDDGIEGYLTFIASVIRSIEFEELRLDLMSTLMQTAINARTTDLSRKKR